MQHSTNFNMNKPERADQYNLDHWNENTDILDTALQNEIDNRIADVNAEETRASNAETALRGLTDLTLKESIFNYVFPIGTIYRNASNSNNPHDIFGFGTWTRITDRFLVANGSIYNGDTNGQGGSATVTLVMENMPYHVHSVSANTTDNDANFTIEPHKADITVSHDHSHTFPIIVADRSGGLVITRASYDSGADGNMTTRLLSDDNPNAIWCTVYDNGHNHGVTQVAHHHSISTTTGGAGGNPNTPFSIIPPYQAVYTWKRTA